MPLGRAETGVGAVICAAHRSADGQLHGHTYEVVAWFPEGEDAVHLQKHLEARCRGFDHRDLSGEEAAGEGLAKIIRKLMEPFGCVEVEVLRPLERIYARTRA